VFAPAYAGDGDRKLNTDINVCCANPTRESLARQNHTGRRRPEQLGERVKKVAPGRAW
jgi:hypothetical protein